MEEELEQIYRHLRRTQRMIEWMVDGHGQHGITPMMFPDLQPDRIEELYNVNFGD
jgi:hypothetical protein